MESLSKCSPSHTSHLFFFFSLSGLPSFFSTNDGGKAEELLALFSKPA